MPGVMPGVMSLVSIVALSSLIYAIPIANAIACSSKLSVCRSVHAHVV